MIHAATEQFIPAGVAGVLLTVVLYRFAPENLWMLPGLWQIVFSLGLFAACRSLPRPMFAAARLVSRGRPRQPRLRERRTTPSRPTRWRYPTGSGQFYIAVALHLTSGAAMPKASPKPERTGRFAYEGLDRVIHEKARLSVLTSLVAHPKGLVFVDLKALCGLTDGNLSRHLAVLEEAGLIEIEKATSTTGRRPSAA